MASNIQPPSDSPTDEATAAKPEADLQNPSETPSFGWNAYAERINGRFAMVGFVALLLLEAITRQDFFTWLGFGL